jgi:hypothetical protein
MMEHIYKSRTLKEYEPIAIAEASECPFGDANASLTIGSIIVSGLRSREEGTFREQ